MANRSPTSGIRHQSAQNVSNSYTPSAHPGSDKNPEFNRVITSIKADGTTDVSTILGNAYSGDNPRAVVSTDGTKFYSAGNADKAGSSIGTLGARYTTLGATSSTKLGTADTTNAKADNFRGIGIYNGNLYVSKGSGSNGSNGVFQVGTGVPTSLSTSSNTITELPGFPTGTSSIHSFGFFFANPNTLYVADEGPGDGTVDQYAGLEKWTYNGTKWTNIYTITNGLNLGVATTITGYPVQSATVGLRNLTGKVNGDGTVSFYAITAQYSNISGGEPDPTKLVAVSDTLAATSLPTADTFQTLQTSGPGEVFRGVAFAPAAAVPEPVAAYNIAAFIALGGLIIRRRLRK